jgi:hypothetical protein
LERELCPTAWLDYGWRASSPGKPAPVAEMQHVVLTALEQRIQELAAASKNGKKKRR